MTKADMDICSCSLILVTCREPTCRGPATTLDCAALREEKYESKYTFVPTRFIPRKTEICVRRLTEFTTGDQCSQQRTPNAKTFNKALEVIFKKEKLHKKEGRKLIAPTRLCGPR